MRKYKIDNLTKKKKELSDEDVLNALKLEASNFVPNDLAKIEKATGTFNPLKERDDYALTEIVHNEGEDMVPDVKDAVYQKAGIQKKFSFKESLSRHTPLILALTFLLVGGTTAGVIISQETAPISKENTIVTLTLESASTYAAKQNENAYGPSTGSEFSPSFTFIANENNIVKKTSLCCSNYSASIIKEKQETTFNGLDDANAPIFTASLLKPAYETGYIETKSPTEVNHITITICSFDEDYVSTYKSLYLSTINDALSSSSVGINAYAKVDIVDQSSDDLVSKLKTISKDKAKLVAEVYWALSKQNANISIDNLINEDTSVLQSMKKTINDIQSSYLSPVSLKSTLGGIAYAYNAFKTSSVKSTEDISKLKETLKAKPTALPWCDKDESRQNQVVKELSHDSYYMVDDPYLMSHKDNYVDGLTINDESTALAYFFHIRDEIVKGLSQSDLISLLNEMDNRALSNGPGVFAFPDGYTGGANVDHGDHGGPGGNGGENPAGWGPGGVR
jgi:hypothetical protein